MVTLNQIAELIEERAPLQTQEDWDNSGWQIRLAGEAANGEIHRILVTLEISEDVVSEAVSEGVQLIVCHHPLIFGGLKKVDSNTVIGNMVCQLVQKGISVYATHTPFDKCEGGNNDYLARLLGLVEIQPIAGDESGICRMGRLETLQTAWQIAEGFSVRTGQDRRNYRLAGDTVPDKLVKFIGMCTGAGSEFMSLAAAAGCDLYVTGDVKYHEAQHARELGLTLLDMGHFGSEQIFTENMAGILREALDGQVEVLESKVCLNPFTAIE